MPALQNPRLEPGSAQLARKYQRLPGTGHHNKPQEAWWRLLDQSPAMLFAVPRFAILLWMMYPALASVIACCRTNLEPERRPLKLWTTDYCPLERAPSHVVLYYIVLYYTILYYFIVYYITLSYIILYYIILYYIILYYITLYCIIVYYLIL